MRVVFYGNAHGDAAGRFELEVVSRVSEKNRQVFRTIPDLAGALKGTGGEECLVVYLAGDSEELASLCSISRLLEGARLLLIAPDQREETIARAHSLYPRFLGFVDDDFSEVGEVLSKMAGPASGENSSGRRGARTGGMRDNLSGRTGQP